LDYYPALLEGVLGDKDEAICQTEKARKIHDPFMAHFRADLKLVSLRSDPRFGELIRLMNMPN